MFQSSRLHPTAHHHSSAGRVADLQESANAPRATRHVSKSNSAKVIPGRRVFRAAVVFLMPVMFAVCIDKSASIVDDFEFQIPVIAAERNANFIRSTVPNRIAHGFLNNPQQFQRAP
jgi:hypothetical protein